MVVDEIKAAPEPTKEQLEALRNQLDGEFQNDVQQTFVAALLSQQGVKIHENVYKRAVGLDQSTQ